MGADPFTAPLMVASTLISGQQQSKAAKKAAGAQTQAADQAAQAQREALQQYRLATEPFRFAGQQALNPLLARLGIGAINVPQRPSFDFMTGLPAAQQDKRRAEIEERIRQLREMRG